MVFCLVGEQTYVNRIAQDPVQVAAAERLVTAKAWGQRSSPVPLRHGGSNALHQSLFKL